MGWSKGWFHQHRFAFHITVLLDVMNDLLHECDLLCIQRFVIDKFRDPLHGGIVVQLCHFTAPADQRAYPETPVHRPLCYPAHR